MKFRKGIHRYQSKKIPKLIPFAAIPSDNFEKLKEVCKNALCIECGGNIKITDEAIFCENVILTEDCKRGKGSTCDFVVKKKKI